MPRKFFCAVLLVSLLMPVHVDAQAGEGCDVQGYVQQTQSLLDEVVSAVTPPEIDALRLRWNGIVADTCTFEHYSAIQYGLSELYISQLLKDSDPSLSQEHLDRFREVWEEAGQLYASFLESVSSIETQQSVERDGLSWTTAFLLQEPGPIFDGQGTLVVERAIRGATYRDASALNYQHPDSGREFLLVWATFTCQQTLCDRIEDRAFFVIGNESIVYSNLIYVRGGLFENQLAGQTLQGGSVSGWLWFEVSQTDSGFILMDEAEEPRLFSLSAFPADAELLTVTASGTVNLRSCADTSCGIVGQAVSGDQLMILQEEGEWFQVRTEDGLDAYIFGNLVRRE